MWNYFLDKLDVLVYIVIFVIIYICLLYLWRKVAQLETSFGKLERTLASMMFNEKKEDFVEPTVDNVFSTSGVVVEEIPPPVPVPEPPSQDPELETDGGAVKQPVVNTLTRSKLSKMSVDELREHLTSMDESTDGTKQELINRILVSQVVDHQDTGIAGC